MTEVSGEVVKRALDETGWLIERRGQWWGPIYSAHEERWAVDPRLWEQNWTSDPNRVVRFARKEDAEMQIKYHGWQGAVATEHKWLALSPASFGGSGKV